MPFFIPRRLIDYQYFQTGRQSAEELQEIEPYIDEIDFAWFVVNFNYSRQEYDALTQTEKAFIKKAYEDKIVSDTTLIRDAVLNAVSNANRKKGKRFRELWRKKMSIVNKHDEDKKISTIKEIEKGEAGWIKKIYAANAGKITRRKG